MNPDSVAVAWPLETPPSFPDQRRIVADILLCTTRHLATTPGGLRFSSRSHDWLEGLVGKHREIHSTTLPSTTQKAL